MTPRAVRSIRLALGLTVEQFAAKLGLPGHDINEYEHGRLLLDDATLVAALEGLNPVPAEGTSLGPGRPHPPPGGLS